MVMRKAWRGWSISQAQRFAFETIGYDGNTAMRVALIGDAFDLRSASDPNWSRTLVHEILPVHLYSRDQTRQTHI